MRFIPICAVAGMAAVSAYAQAEHKYPPKRGVQISGVQVPLSNLHPLAVVSIPGSPDWIAVGDDVWVSNKPKDSVSRVDSKTAQVKQVLGGFNKPCSGLAIGFGSLWVPNCGNQTVTRVDLPTGRLTATFPITIADSEGGITAGAGSVWMLTDSKSTLSRIDPAANRVVASVALPQGCYTPAFGFDSVWVTCTKQNTVVRVNPATNSIQASIPVGPEPRFLTTGEGAVWTLNQADGTVTRIDPSSSTAQATIAVGVPGEGGDISAGEGSVWVTSFGFPLTRIDPATNMVRQQFVGKGGDAIRAAGGNVWLSNYLFGTEWKIDPKHLQGSRP